VTCWLAAGDSVTVKMAWLVPLGHDHVEDGERGLGGRGEDSQAEDPVAGHAQVLSEAPDASVWTEEVAMRRDAAQVGAEADRVDGKDVEELHPHAAAGDRRRRHGLARHQDVVEQIAAVEDVAVLASPDLGARGGAAAVVLVDEDVVRVAPAPAAKDADAEDGVGILPDRSGELGGQAFQVADARVTAQGATTKAVVLEKHLLGAGHVTRAREAVLMSHPLDMRALLEVPVHVQDDVCRPRDLPAVGDERAAGPEAEYPVVGPRLPDRIVD